MRSFWSDPYLWIHLAGLAAFPLLLEGCLIGFTVGDPILPIWLELLLVATVGIAPTLWMQWQRPFYIFSVVAVSVKPEALTDDQRRLLTLFKMPRNRVLAVLASVALVVVLRKVYEIAPIAAPAVLFLPTSRLLGLLLAAVAFLACNLFVQVPISVASVMLSKQSAFAATIPAPLETIRRNFTLLGLQLNQIVPSVLPDAKSTLAEVDQSNVSQASEPDAIAMSQATGSTEPLTNDVWAETATTTNGASLTDSEVEAGATENAVTNHSLREMPATESSSEPGASQS